MEHLKRDIFEWQQFLNKNNLMYYIHIRHMFLHVRSKMTQNPNFYQNFFV